MPPDPSHENSNDVHPLNVSSKLFHTQSQLVKISDLENSPPRKLTISAAMKKFDEESTQRLFLNYLAMIIKRFPRLFQG